MDALIDEVNHYCDEADRALVRADLLLGQLPVLDQGDDAENRGTARPTAPAAVKANMALKPFVLTLDHTPVQMTRWLEAWKAFYDTSNLGLLSNSNVQSYFKAFIDDQLREVLFARVTEATPVFGIHSVESELKSIFLERFPLFHRREVFFEAKFTGSIRDVPSFVNNLEALALAAELDAIDRETLVAYKGLQAINDKELKRLAAREESLTLDRFRQLIVQRVRESGNMRSAHDFPADTSVNAINQIGPCYYCQKPGHLASDCYKKKNDRNSSSSSSSKRKEGKSKSKSSSKQEKEVKYVNKKKKKKSTKKSSYKKKGKARQLKEGEPSGESNESGSEESGSENADSDTPGATDRET